MSGGGQSPVTTTTQNQTSAPWGAAVPYLSGVMGEANNQYQQAVNTGIYPGQRVADLDPAMQEAMGAVNTVAQDPSTIQGVINAQTLSNQQMQNYGMTPDLNKTITGLGTVGGQYGDIYNQAKGTQNPYLQQILDTQNRRISDTINSQFSGAGRYGSAMNQDVVARALGEAEAPTLAQDYQQRQQTMMGATAGLGNVYNAQAGIYNQGLNRAGQFAQLAPTLAQARFIPANAMMGTAQIQQQHDQAVLDAQQAAWNEARWGPLQALNMASGDITSAAGLGGKTTSGVGTSSTQVPFGQRVLGGALAGAGLGSSFGPWGSAVGGLGGAAAGGFL